MFFTSNEYIRHTNGVTHGVTQVTYLRRQRRVERLTTKLTLTERPQRTHVSTNPRVGNAEEGLPVARPKL